MLVFPFALAVLAGYFVFRAGDDQRVDVVDKAVGLHCPVGLQPVAQTFHALDGAAFVYVGVAGMADASGSILDPGNTRASVPVPGASTSQAQHQYGGVLDRCQGQK